MSHPSIQEVYWGKHVSFLILYIDYYVVDTMILGCGRSFIN